MSQMTICKESICTNQFRTLLQVIPNIRMHAGIIELRAEYGMLLTDGTTQGKFLHQVNTSIPSISVRISTGDKRYSFGRTRSFKPALPLVLFK